MTADSQSNQPTRYKAGAFHPDLEGGRASGSLALTSKGVSFESPKGAVFLPMQGLQVEIGGASQPVIFFKHPEFPRSTIHTDDQSVLKEPLLADRQDIAAQLRSEKRKKVTVATVLLTIFGIFVAGIVLLIASKDRIVTSITNSIPTDWEVKFGDQVFNQIMSGKREITDPALLQQLNVLTEPLLSGIEDSRYPFRFHIVEDPTLNAFAVPGGHVVIHSGLLLAADKPEEVAGVLAHEIAHVTQRHSFRNMVSSLGMSQLIRAFFGDSSGMLAVLANSSELLMNRKFSRDFERDADDKGWEYLMRANIQPDGMIEFFRKLKVQEEKIMPNGASGALSLISTHPATHERMEFLQAKWQKVETKTGFHVFPIDFPKFKEELQSQLKDQKSQN